MRSERDTYEEIVQTWGKPIMRFKPHGKITDEVKDRYGIINYHEKETWKQIRNNRPPKDRGDYLEDAG